MAAGTRQAKIQITADNTDLARKAEEGRRILAGITKDSSLDRYSREVQSNLDDVKTKLEEVGSAAKSAFDPKEVRDLVREYSRLGAEMSRIQATASRMGGGPGGGDAPGGGRGRGAMGMLGGLLGATPMGRFGRLLGAGALAGAAIGLYRRQVGTSREQLNLRALSGITEGESPVDIYGERNLGFDYASRRQRGGELLRAHGGNMEQRRLNRLIDRGELEERAFGIGGQTQAGLIGAARRAGMGNLGRIVPEFRGEAQKGGLEGQRVIEFLESMTESLSSLSEGVNIDGRSIARFASSLIAGSRFFGADPRRAGMVIRGIDQAFTSGDRFQRAMFARAMRRAAGAGGETMDATGIELRRGLGLNFNVRRESEEGGVIDRLRKAGEAKGIDTSGIVRALSIEGPKILEAAFDEVRTRFSGLSLSAQALEFGEAFNLPKQTAIELFTKRFAGEKFTGADVAVAARAEKEVEEDQVVTAVREAKAMMENVDGSIMFTATAISKAVDAAAEGLSKMIVPELKKIVEALGKLVDGFGFKKGEPTIVEKTMEAMGIKDKGSIFPKGTNAVNDPLGERSMLGTETFNAIKFGVIPSNKPPEPPSIEAQKAATDLSEGMSMRAELSGAEQFTASLDATRAELRALTSVISRRPGGMLPRDYVGGHV